MFIQDTKSATILLILNTLKEYSDKDHYLTQKDIIQKVENDSGITLERKTVGKYISLLSELGYDINQKGTKGGVALLSRELDESQIQFLVDAIFSSKNITGKQAQDLSNVLYGMLSRNQRKKYAYLYKSEDINRNSDADFFLNIEIINEAVEQKKQISFQYADYDRDGNETLRMHGFIYQVSPFYLVNNFGKYYLLASMKNHKNISTFRVDYIRNIKIEEADCINIESVNNGNKFDIYDYINRHVYIFGDKVSFCKLLVHDEKAYSDIIDWFGKKAEFKTKDGNTFVSFYCDEAAFYYWSLQYGELIEVIEPKSVAERLATNYRLMADRYENVFDANEVRPNYSLIFSNFIYHHLPKKIENSSITSLLKEYMESMITKGNILQLKDDALLITYHSEATNIRISQLRSSTRKNDFIHFFNSLMEDENMGKDVKKSYELVFVEDELFNQANSSQKLRSLLVDQNIIKETPYVMDQTTSFTFSHNYHFTIKKIPDTRYCFFLFEARKPRNK